MLKLFNIKLKKILIILLVIILVFNMFPNKVQAASLLATAGGIILDTVLDFLVFLGDSVLNILQKNFISTDDVVIEAQSKEVGTFKLWRALEVIIGVLIIAVSICTLIASLGSLSGASIAGVLAGIKVIGGVILGTGLGTVLSIKGTINIVKDAAGYYDLPQIRYTPYEIFSNQIPVFDINFIDPMKSVYSTDSQEKVEEQIANGNYIDDFAKSVAKYIVSKCSDIQIDSSIEKKISDLIDELQANNNQKARSLAEYSADASATINGKKVEALVSKLQRGANWRAYCIVDDILIYQFDSEEQGINTTLDECIQNMKDELNYYFSNSDLDQNPEEKDDEESIKEIVKEVCSKMVKIDHGIEYIDNGNNWVERNITYTHKCDGNSISLRLLFEESKVEKRWSCLVIDDTADIIKEYKSSASILQSSIATWYKVLRRVALIGLLSTLVYVGIRIIISSPSGKSKYKSMFLNWLVAVCILFLLQYLMVFILTLSTNLTNIFVGKGEPNIIVDLPKNTAVKGEDGEWYNLTGQRGEDDLSEDNYPAWSTSFTGYLRLIGGIYGGKDNDQPISPTNLAYLIMYLIMVIYTCVFTFMYLRRVLYMAFLTMIAPLIALTYPLDKLKDSKAQALGLWIREYIFNALIQPVHLILYVMVVSNIMDFVQEHPIYALIALGFLLPAEKFIRNMFGFNRAETFGQLADAAVGASVMTGINKLSGLNRRRSSQEEAENTRVRTEDFKENMEVPDTSMNENVEEPRQNVNNAPEQASRSDVERRYRELERNGLNSSQIRQHLNRQFSDRDLVDSVMRQHEQDNNNSQNNNSQNNDRQSQDDQTPIGNLNLPTITPARVNEEVRRGFRAKLASGLMNVGYKNNKRRIKAKPLRTIGKYTGMAFGGAALGLLGLAAGISTGDISNTLKYTTAGLGVGTAVGGTLGQNVGDIIHEQSEAFKEGYYGSEEYRNRQYDKNFLNSPELREMVANKDIHPELRGGLVKEVERARLIASEAHEYHRVGITDVDKISTCIKAGLTPEEGRYAILLSKTMKKDDITKTPERMDRYKKRYMAAFQNQNTSDGNKQKIEDIWSAALRMRFK